MTDTLPDRLALDGVRFDLDAVHAAAGEHASLRGSGGGEGQLYGLGGLGLASTDRFGDRRALTVDLVEGKPIEAREALPDPLLERAGVVVFRYAAHAPDQPDNPRVAAFRTVLVEAERATLARAVRWCQAFLTARRSGDQKLSAHPVVAYQLAGLVAAAASLRQADLAAALASPAGRRWLAAEIDTVAIGLIKMAGGRSLLAGQMVALRTTVLTMNRVYLDGAPCPN